MAPSPRAKRALARLVAANDPRCIRARDARSQGLGADYRAAQRNGLIVSAGSETSVAAEDWLRTPEGEAALAEARAELQSRHRRSP